MGSNWAKVSIESIKANEKGSIAIGPFGSRLKSDNYVSDGIPVIRGTNVTAGPTFKGDFVYITEDKADSLGACNVYKNELVFPHRGSIGEVGFVQEDKRYVLSSSLMKLKVDEEQVNPMFLYYFFKSSTGKHELLKNASQVGTPGIGQPLSSLKSILFNKPPLVIQNKIVDVLSSVNNKLELNNQINQTLEQMAQTLFKFWFVDFDPVKAKMNDEQPEWMDAPFLSKEVASLFPEKLVESELGLIPEGWEVGELSDLMDFNPKRTLKKGTVAPYLDMKNMPTAGHLALDIYDREMGSGTKFVNGDALLARITPCLENGKTAFVDFLEDEQVGWGSTEYIVMRSKSDSYKYFSYFMARFEPFRKFAIQSMTGTSGRQRAQAKTVQTMPFVIPPLSILEKFDELIAANMQLIKRHGDENKTLAELRDTLLPKLLSGEIDLENVQVEQAKALAE
ncbi:restriction endonuclease subunit S [Vibrio sp. 10N.222.55.C6]|uniref:restriction endonuclease subunit S n=1 Tax=Vibrio sp. 10N.222.55.C6 TaxID=3229649 RepID=UPI0035530100